MPRRYQTQESDIRLARIRSLWELPYVYQFVSLTQRLFSLPCAVDSIQNFEQEIISDNGTEIQEITHCLLRYLNNKDKAAETTELHLASFLKLLRLQDLLPGNEYSQTSPEQKIHILWNLIEKINERYDEEVSDFLNDHYSPDQLRAECIGQDALCNTYWYFDDLRLYREQQSSGKPHKPCWTSGQRRDWSCICVTLHQWSTFLKQFRKSSNPHEKALYTRLHDEVFPLVQIQLEKLDGSRAAVSEGGVIQQGQGAMLKEQDNTTPGSAGGSIKSEPPTGVKEELDSGAPHTPQQKTPSDMKDPSLTQNGIDSKDSLEDIKPKLEGVDAALNPNSGEEAKTPIVCSQDAGGPVGTPQPLSSTPQPQGISNGTPGPQATGMPPTSMESQFMQNQSQIFVFSTQLANKAAEAVLSGQYKNILNFHIDQDATKKILQKYPLKTSQFARGGQPVQFMRGPAPGMKGGPMGDNGLSSVAQWVQQQNANLQQGGPGMPNQPSGPNSMSFSPPMAGMGGSFSPNSMGGPGGNFPPHSMSNWNPNQGPPPSGMQSPPYMQGANGGPPNGPMGPQNGPMGPQNGPMGPQNSPMGPQNGPMGPQPPYSGGMGPNMAMMGMNSNSLLQSKVPNENLTPEQLQRREEQLANLRKIQAMLFPEQQGPGGQPGNMGPNMNLSPNMMDKMGSMMMGPNGPMGPQSGPGGPMGPNGPMMRANMPMGPNGSMGPNGLMGPGGPMGPNGPMGPGPMGPGGPGPMGPNGPMPPMGVPYGQLPPNWDTMTQPQREWFKLQQEFYFQKRHRHQMEMQRMGSGMGPGGPMNMPPGQGPPPPYYHSMRGRGMMPGDPMSPSSPNGPLPSPHMGSTGAMSPGPDPYMFPGPSPGQRFPGPGGPGMNNYGPVPRPGFDPSMGPNGPADPMFMKDMGKNMPEIHHAGNPEQFHPEEMHNPPNSANSLTKPPPTYAQSTGKRKRSSTNDEIDEIYKKLQPALQPAPSPQQFSYLNQFDGQELTITKQLNLAYQETGSPASQQQNQQQSQAPNQQQQNQQGSQPPNSNDFAGSSISSPMSAHNASMAGTPNPMTTSSSLSNVGSPMPAQAQQNHRKTPQGGPQGGQSQQRLSHYDPPSVPSPGGSLPPSSKSTMSNITSASLANLAKGVEHLSNQMQQNMMQGGPFHNIQIQGQMADMEGGSQPNSQPSTPSTTMPNMTPSSVGSGPGGQVNNTYVNATMSIQQLNIQSVNQPSMNPSMQIQQMNQEMNMPPMSMSGPVGMSMADSMPPHSSMSMSQSQSMMMQQGMGPDMPGKFQGPGGPMQGGRFPGPMPPHGMHGPHHGNMAPTTMSGRPPSPGMMSSPMYRQSPGGPPMSNANVQIQAKTPNTIQYLPANPPNSQAGPMPPMGKDFSPEMLPRFPSPLGQMDNMKNKMGGPYGYPGQPGRPGDMGGPMGPMDHMGGPMGPGPGQMGMQQGGMMMGGPRTPGSMGGSMMQYGGPGSMSNQPHHMPGSMMGGGPSMEMMQGQQMRMGGPMGPMQGGPMGPRMQSEGPMMGPGGGSSYNYQQFQQQLYSQGRPRQMSPTGMGNPGPMQGGMMSGGHPGMRPDMGPMMGGPNGPMMGPGGPGPMGGGGPYSMNMMPNMP